MCLICLLSHSYQLMSILLSSWFLPRQFRYEVQRYNKLTSACHSNCDGCTGPLNTECNQCASSIFFHTPTTECLTTCPDAFYGDTSDSKCKGKWISHLACHSYCATCTGPANSECPSCTASSFAVSSTLCDTSCLSTQYADANKICHSCSDTCLTCSNAGQNNCLTCTTSSYAFNPTTCLSVCPDGYWHS